MTNPQINVKGWKAIPVILVVLAIVGYKYYAMKSTLDTNATQVINFWLLAEYAGKALNDPKLTNFGAMPSAEADLAAEELLKLQKIDIKSIGARGKGDNIVVRVEIEVDGKAPPDGKSIRYFHMRHSTITGWSMKRDASWPSYYLKLL
ncbi:MAG: hypothetical protein JRJ47_08470 [Deltaproteobacteria bacterium]|nr:hypothetical protein [Deltaproteobacteria bacterium]